MGSLASGLLVGIDEIDQQHEEMVALIGSIVSQVNQRHHQGNPIQGRLESACCRKVRSMLHDLTELTLSHFQTEERLMAESGFPGLADHRYEHKILLAELKQFVRSVCRGNECITHEDLGSLRRWLIGHIVMDDKAMARYLTTQSPLPLLDGGNFRLSLFR